MNTKEQSEMEQEVEDLFVEEEIGEDLEEQSASEQETDKASKIPDKFKDKSVEDIVNSYLELEKAYGQRSNEIGEYRKLTDQLLEQQLQTKKKLVEETEELSVDFNSLVDNPEEAVSKIVSAKTKALEEKLQLLEREKEKARFEQTHPDWMEVISSPDFQQWVTSSTLYQNLFIEADRNYDYAKGSELLNLYKNVHSLTAETRQKEMETKQKKKEKALKNATLETATSGTPSRKVFSRKQLIQLKITNPAKYEAMSDEIRLAYAEGRIKD